MLLSERIKEIRKSEKLTQTKFGDKLSVSRDVISSFESGRVEPKPIFLNYLCEIFNINKDWLLTGEGEMYKQLSPEEEFAFLIGNIAASDNPKLKKLINVLSQIDNEEDLDLILNLCKRLAVKKEV